MEALEDPECPVASMYNIKYAVKMNRISEEFKGGLALFTDPAVPIKCAGSPHKIAFLSGDRWAKMGLREKTQLEFHKGLGIYFSVPKYAAALKVLHDERKNTLKLDSNLIKIDGKARIAHFQNMKTKEISTIKFDLLHFVPPQSPYEFIQASGLAAPGGYVDVDSSTLQHKTYKNIWALGDNANLPTSKTAAALMSQSIVLMKNLLRLMKRGEIPKESYNGYTSCPILTGENKLMLCEFKYGAELDETFLPNRQHVPRRIFFIVKRYIFPWVYFYLMPRGLWLGKKGVGMAFY